MTKPAVLRTKGLLLAYEEQPHLMQKRSIITYHPYKNELMKTAKILHVLCLLLCCLFGPLAFGQAQNTEESTKTEAQETTTHFNAAQTFLIEITGPNGYYHSQETAKAPEYRISPIKADGTPFADGSYQMQVTPVYRLSEAQQEDLNLLRENNDLEGIAAYRVTHGLPAEANVYVVNYGIKGGKFVASSKEEDVVKAPRFADAYQAPTLANSMVSFTYYEGSYEPLAMDRTKMAEDDQVFLDDVIVDGSLCVGQDCVNGENFGFDTQRLKENNLRIHFDDTSNSASFPSNDWRIAINDSNNGGASYFAIQDATAGTTPMTIKAGAGNNALYVSNSGGNVGMGTASPVVELHITDGDSPTMRLEQNGASGWTPQTWDVAGNETNFFVRDVTNGSKLPFKIRPGAPDNSIYIDAEGDIGLGTANPGSNGLQVESGNVYVKNGNLGINTAPSTLAALEVVGGMNVTGTTLFTGDHTHFMSTGATFFSPAFSTVLKLDAVNERVGIGTATPMHQLEVSTDDVVKPTAGGWLGASDRRLKKDIADFDDGLEVLMNIRPVTYSYNGKLGLPTGQEHIGIIAQEIQPLAPYTIKPLKIGGPDNDENYLAFDGSPLTYVLINAVQEQQKTIEAQQKEIDVLRASVAEIKELKAQMASISKMLDVQKTTVTSGDQSREAREE